jgi:TRAP transporter 4TM/12TM fusion protein
VKIWNRLFPVKSGHSQSEPAQPNAAAVSPGHPDVVPVAHPDSVPLWFRGLRFLLAVGWIGFQLLVVFNPQVPMVQRPVHVAFAVALVFLYRPLAGKGPVRHVLRAVDLLAAFAGLAIGAYFVANAGRIQSRIVMIDPVFPADVVLCVVLVVLLIEAVRRTVGWSLLIVVLAFLLYGWFGYIFPGWARFDGIAPLDYVELLFLGDSGIFGIPVETSLLFVFYFVLFGAIYSTIGGSRLLVELGLRLTRKQKGGAAKAAIIASSLMGTVSGSAVANVTTTGVFTIPFMIRSGYKRETAGAVEAIASTGGQLMPPIMGIGAFVMAELLGVPYLRIALAAVLPALLFYLSLYFLIDFNARKAGIESFELAGEQQGRILPVAHLLVPLLVVVFFIVRGYSPTMAALYGCAGAVVVSFLRKENRLSLKKAAAIVDSTGRQAASVAIPIAAIGIIIAVAIQSNLALKFSSKLIDISGGSMIASLFFIIVGCVILGMGLPTVAAYIMGAVFFAPPLLKFGIPQLAAHFFVFYFSILAMITPPVALASFTAAGLAEGNVTRTGVRAFVMSLVAFMIPFIFIFKPALLWEGNLTDILLLGLFAGTGTVLWAAALSGYLGGRLHVAVRLLLGAASLVIILPTSRAVTIAGIGSALLVLAVFRFLVPRLAAGQNSGGGPAAPAG